MSTTEASKTSENRGCRIIISCDCDCREEGSKDTVGESCCCGPVTVEFRRGSKSGECCPESK